MQIKFKHAITLLLTLTLVACQSNKPLSEEEVAEQANSATTQELYDVRGGPDMQLIRSEQIQNGFMYSYTNGGLPEKHPDLKRKLVAVEVLGQSKASKLASFFPPKCQQLNQIEQTIEGYPTWIDSLYCPNYTESGQGMLVVNKAVQGKQKFFAATLYQLFDTPLNLQAKELYQLNMPPQMLQSVLNFTRNTRIIEQPVNGNN